jgi:hypothetical protein
MPAIPTVPAFKVSKVNTTAEKPMGKASKDTVNEVQLHGC